MDDEVIVELFDLNCKKIGKLLFAIFDDYFLLKKLVDISF